jgi:DNA-binding response OmpR family regulator
MAFKPSMRRIYLVIKQPPAYQEVMQVLGFKEAANTYLEVEGTGYHCMANDMGPGSVDGWLTSLAERELGVMQRFRLQVEGRQLLVDDQRLDLTPLEFGVAQCLLARPGRTVSREHLLQQVWHTDYQGGSNVVDAVVRTLRKKLAAHASAIATVTGVGYRLNLES